MSSALNARLQSLDAFRGFTIVGMILVNNPGDWKSTYAQLLHAQWHGWTFTDWIFPFFLFISGVSMVMSVRNQSKGADSLAICFQLIKRALIIIALGLMLNFIPLLDLSTLRIPGVLQRIGLCVLLAAPLVAFGTWRSQAAAIVLSLLIYSYAMLAVAVPDANGVIGIGLFEPGRDTGAYIDRLLLSGHLWASAKTWDPEGLLSTLPALASLLFGCLTTHWLAWSSKKSAGKKDLTLLGLMLTGVACLALGEVLALGYFPINKSLWTPSYTVFMTGVALIIFGWFFWAIDMVRLTQCKPLVVMGMNALFLFVLSSLIAKTLNTIKLSNALGQTVNLKTALFTPIANLGLSPINASLVFAVGFLLVMFLIGYFMYRRGWFIKV